MESQNSAEAKHPDPSTLWRNRRRMAWLALLALLAIAAAAFVIDELKPGNADVIGGVAFALSIIVVAYFANNAAEALAGRSKR